MKSMNGCFRGDERQAHNPQIHEFICGLFALRSLRCCCLGSFLLFFNFISSIIEEIELIERRNGPQPATQPSNKFHSIDFTPFQSIPFLLFDWFAPPPTARLSFWLVAVRLAAALNPPKRIASLVGSSLAPSAATNFFSSLFPF